MIRIAFELDRATVARLGDDAAARAAFAARRRVVGRNAGHGLVGRDEIWNELAGRLGARGRGERCARRAEDLEELAALDASWLRILAHVSSGSSRSRSAPSCVRSWRPPQAPACSAVRLLFRVAGGLESFLRAVAVDVTAHAPAHVEARELIDAIHLLDLAVARLAGDAGVDVTRVREVDVLRKLVNAHPRNGLGVRPHSSAGHRDVSVLVELRELRAVCASAPRSVAGRSGPIMLWQPTQVDTAGRPGSIDLFAALWQ